MLEKEIEAKCRAVARGAGYRLVKWTSPGNAGVPDRILLGPDRVVFIEFKQPGKQLTPRQARWKRWIEDYGLRHEIVRSVEEFMAVLDSA